MTRNSFVTSEMRLKYLQRRTDELAQAAEKLGAQDFDYFKMIGHQIKGNAVTFEFPTLTGLGVSLENHAVEKNQSGVEKTVGELKLAVQGLLDRVKNEKPEI